MPASPCTTSAALRPSRTPAKKSSIVLHSFRRPRRRLGNRLLLMMPPRAEATSAARHEPDRRTLRAAGPTASTARVTGRTSSRTYALCGSVSRCAKLRLVVWPRRFVPTGTPWPEDLEDGIGKCLGRFLRQVVPGVGHLVVDPAPAEPGG